MSIDNKNLENNLLDDDALEQVSGGKKYASNLRCDKKNKDAAKLSNTIMKDQKVEVSNLLYKDDDRINSILSDDARLC